MPPDATRKSSNQTKHRAHPYSREDTASVMTSPTSPTTPRLAAGPWQPEDDEKLIQARKQSLNWSDISQQYFPAKTANACRKRHERLMDKRHTNEEWQPYKLEQMAVAYLDCREEMWKILAQAVGENWKDVESKVSTRALETHSRY